MPVEEGGHGEPPFDALGLAAFLAADARPTLVLDIKHPHRVVYTNPAFQATFALKDSQTLDDSFEPLLQWLLSAHSAHTSHRGRSWTAFTIHNRWKVVTCAGDDSVVHTNATIREASALEPPSAKRTKTSLDRGSSADSDPSSLERDGSRDSADPVDQGRSYIDWTQADLPGLTPYVQSLRKRDWASTPLGPMAFWPLELRLVVVNIMENPDPRLLLWGPEYTLIYNEACVPIIGQRHPRALGSSPWDVFPEIWDNLSSIVDAAMYKGQTSHINQMPLSLARNPEAGEETYFSFVMQPILGKDGSPLGALDSFTEVTSTVLAERRMRTVLKVGENTAAADNIDGVWKGVLAALDSNVDDVPFAVLYSVSKDGGPAIDPPYSRASSPDNLNSKSTLRCVLEGVVGFESAPMCIQDNLDLEDEDKTLVRQIRQAWRQRTCVLLSADDGTLPKELCRAIPGRVAGITCSQAIVCPIFSLTASDCLAFLLLGLNPRRLYDEDYELFVRLLNERANHSAVAVSLPKEHRRIQAAAEEAAMRHATLSRQLLVRTQEAEQREAKFTRMASAAPVGCYLLRVDGTPIYLNEAYYDITGIQRPEQLSFGEDSIWREQVLPEDIAQVEHCWLEITREKRPAVVEYRLRREWRAVDKVTGVEMSGPTWLLVSAFPELDDHGEVKTVIGWVSDISLQKWTEALQTKRLTEALESKLQSERFIDLVSHEMRNPLSAILQSADSILQSLTDSISTAADGSIANCLPNQGSRQVAETIIDPVVDSAKTIVLCAQHQKRIVDDILTFSKLDSDLLVLCPEKVRPVDLTKKALKMYEAELQSADISADIIVDDSYAELAVDTVFLDPSRLLQVLINLLTNAIKFTRGQPRREITVTLRSTEKQPPSSASISFMPRRESRPEVPLSREWGDGPEIYLLFAVGDSGRGLSKDEMSSLFMRFSQANPRTHEQYGGSGLGLFISKELTELQGGQIGCSSAYGEGSTFAFYIKARRYARDPQPELKPTQAYEASNGPTKSAPIPQPIEIPEVPAPTLGLPKPEEPSRHIALPTEQCLRKANELHVLIVEDNIINQKVMSSGLKRLGCTVHVANHGLEALQFLQKSSFSTQITQAASGDTTLAAPPVRLSVVLLDLEMPVMDGLTCIQKIREMEQKGLLRGHVPVAAVTANARTEQLNVALSHGMDLVITKPFRIPDLVPKMLALVEGFHVPNENPVFSYIEARRDSV